MKKHICLFLCIVAFLSCGKSDDQPLEIHFEEPIMYGYDVTTITFDKVGNAWMGTWNAHLPGQKNRPELMKYNLATKETTIYDASNSPLEESMVIWSIAVDNNNTVWLACDGLIKFDGTSFTRYTMENSQLPSNFIRNLKVDSKNNIWLSYGSNREGGLAKFDGTNWTLFTPDNSDLPGHGVAGIAIDKNDLIWLTVQGYLTETFLVKITGNTMTVYDSRHYGWTVPYWGGIALNNKNQLYCAIDYSLVSQPSNPRPQVMIFDGNKYQYLAFNETSSAKYIVIDKKTRVWCAGRNQFSVYSGKTWLVDSLTYEDSWINALAIAPDNKVWIGNGNGVDIVSIK